MTRNIYNDNNVYLLGAGFSRLAGLPLIKDFMNQMRDTHQRFDEIQRTGEGVPETQRISQAIAKVFEYRLRASSVNYRINIDLENIEQLFSLATLSELSNEKDLEPSIRLAICATIEGAYQRFMKGNPKRVIRLDDKSYAFKYGLDIDEELRKKWGENMYKMNLYTFILSHLIGDKNSPYGGNTFITLNYDTIVEDSITELGMPFTCGVSEFIENLALSSKYESEEGIKVLKLHGSSNWSESPQNAEKIRLYDNFNSLAYNDDDEPVPLILAPTWNKSARGYLLKVWQNAIEALRNATRIVVIGYSFPTTDNHINYLMAEGLRDNISLRSIHIWDPYPDNVLNNWSQLTAYSKEIISKEAFNTGEDGISLTHASVYKKINRGSGLVYQGKI